MMGTALSLKHAASRLASTPLKHLLGFAYSARHVLAHREREATPIRDADFDIVTVVCGQDLLPLRLQARSLALYMDPTFTGTIVLIVNDLSQGKVIARIRDAILPEYGCWRDRVRIVPFHHLGHGLDPTNGWKIQQALKLVAAAIVSRPFYVVLDSKNHLVRRVHVTDFVTTLGLARQKLDADAPTLDGHSRTCARFLGLRPEDVGPCWPMTPFVFHTRTARDLVDTIERREGRSIFSTFRRVRLLSEFLLYKAHLRISALEGRAAPYEEGALLSRTVWPGQCVRSAIADVEHDTKFLVFGVHRDTMRALSETEKQALDRFWQSRGLLSPATALDNDWGTASFRTRPVPRVPPTSALSYL